MANHKSAEKAAKRSLIKRARNRVIKSKVKTYIKKFLALVEANKLEEARSKLPETESVIMKAVSKGVYKKNNGARKVSMIVRNLKKAEGHYDNADKS